MFAPRLFTTLLAIVLIALLISLGRWQLRRAAEKRALFDSFAAGTDATQSIDLRTPAVKPLLSALKPAAAYDRSRQILIDNMMNGEGRAGYLRDHAVRTGAAAAGCW